MIRFCVALTVLLSITGTVQAGAFITGNDLYSRITSQKITDNVYAIGYVVGVTDSGATEGIYGFKYCLPEVNTQQVYDIVKKWLEENPEVRHYGAYGLVAAALQEAFPCKN